jgi:short-subunit dehydrogenase
MPNLIISGGTKGIGRSIILKFASEGFNIVTCARNNSDLKDLSKSINENFPSIRFYALKCDVSSKSEIINFGKQAIEKFGTIDVLINNAGIFLPGSITSEDDEIFEKQINTNLASAYHLTRVIGPQMIANNGGYIFNMCSTASIMAYTNGGSYCISKFGLLGFSKVLREEMKKYNIRVSSILPGATKTASWEGTDLPDNRFINPDDVANLIYNFYNTPITLNVEEILIRPLEGDIF